MRILFFQSHPMWLHGLPNGFKDLSHEIKISGKLTTENIEEMILSFKPQLIVTLGWSEETSQTNARLIRSYVKKYHILHIYWATEDPTHTFTFTLPLLQTMQPDYVFTICKERIKFYQTLGFKSYYLDFGFHPSVHQAVPQEPDYTCDIAVVANGYPKNLKIYPNHYRIQSLKILIAPLIQQGIRVDFFGWGWEHMAFILERPIPKEWIHGYLEYPLANKVYSSSKIILTLQNQTTQLTQRTYEILASKGFVLTSDTPKVRELFVPGQDLVVSSSPAQTVELVQYFLSNEDKRQAVSQQGQQAVQIHHYKNRAKHILDILYKQGVID